VGASIHRFPRAPSLAVLVEPGPVSGPANRFFIQLPLVNSFSTSFSCQIGIQHQPKPFGKENILTESGKALSAASRLWPRVHESTRAKPLQDFQAATPHAHARSRAPNRKMAQVGRTRLLQLPRGTGKPHESRCVSGCLCSGGVLFAAGARNAGSTGRASFSWLSDGFLNGKRSIPFLMLASPPII
jgi:hypothetical protein